MIYRCRKCGGNDLKGGYVSSATGKFTCLECADKERELRSDRTTKVNTWFIGSDENKNKVEKIIQRIEKRRQKDGDRDTF